MKRPYQESVEEGQVVKKQKMETSSIAPYSKLLTANIENVDLFQCYNQNKEAFLSLCDQQKNINHLWLTPDVSEIRLGARLLSRFITGEETENICAQLNLMDTRIPTLHALVELLGRDIDCPTEAEIGLLKKCIKAQLHTASLIDCYGRNLLHYSFGKENLIKLIKKYYPDIDSTDVEGNTPLHLAADLGFFSLELCSNNNLWLPNYHHKMPMMMYLEHLEFNTILGELLEDKHLKINLDFQDRAGNTLLLHAAKLGCLEAIKILLEKGADPLIKNYDGFELLHIAVAYKQDKVLNYLLKKEWGDDLKKRPYVFNLPTQASIFSLVPNLAIEERLSLVMDEGCHESSPSAFFQKPSDLLKNQKDRFEIKAIDWSYRGNMNLDEFWVSTDKFYKFELDINRFETCKYNQLIQDNFQNIYFLNIQHHQQYQEALNHEIIQLLIPALEIPIIYNFFTKRSQVLAKEAANNIKSEILFTPWGDTIEAFLKERKYAILTEGLHHYYDHKNISRIYIAETLNKVAVITHESLHQLITLGDMDLTAFESHYLTLKQKGPDFEGITQGINALCIKKMEGIFGLLTINYINDETNMNKEREEVLARCMEIILEYRQLGIDWLEKQSPGITTFLSDFFAPLSVPNLTLN